MDEDIRKGLNWLYKEYEGSMPAEEDDWGACGFDWDETKDIVSLSIPRSQEEYSFSKAAFLDLVAECQALDVDKAQGRVRSPKRTLQIVEVKNHEALRFGGKLALPITVEGARCSFLAQSYILGFAAYKLGAYHDDFFAPDNYTCIEVVFEDSGKRPNPEVELELLESCLFEFASQGYTFAKSSFQDFLDSDDEPSDRNKPVPTFRSLETFNEGMRLFNSAILVDDPELRFLSLYKVIEYFAPVVFQLQRNEALRKKLDSPQANHPDANFLESLFQLSIAWNDRMRDAELPSLVLHECIDFVELSNLLPARLKKPVTYQSKRSEIDGQLRIVADTLYATRNNVAHAKSNYQRQGVELSGQELQELNRFIEAAAAQTIRWYNRLPKHLRLSFQ